MLYGIRPEANSDLDYHDGPRVIAVPYKLGDKFRLSRNFEEWEMACRHCGSLGTGIDAELMYRLEQLRERIGNKPISINSGYRCQEHNSSPAVGGAPNSLHRFGYAADIRSAHATPAQIRKIALELGFRGVKQYSTFVHVDMRPLFWNPPIWRPSP